MTTLAALEHYNGLCDELDRYMQEENSHLRSSGTDESLLVDRKKAILAKLDVALASLREAGPVKTTEHAASAEVRKRVLNKILKLLLLSREGEQLLLKNSAMSAPKPVSAPVSSAKVANTYRSGKSAKPQAQQTQADSSWVVW